MSGKQDKAFDDVGSLVNQLDLGGMRYREFGAARKPAEHQPAEHRPAPAAPDPSATAARPQTAEPQPAADTSRLRSVSAGSPLAFTFERLRRQSIASHVRSPVLVLDLPERHAVHADRLPRNARPLRELFAALDIDPQQGGG